MSDVKIWINDQQVLAKAGQTILQAADAAGFYIPRLCYHPALQPSGSCRLCAVEIEGHRGLPAACSTPVSDGMRIRTETSKLMDFRREMLRLILQQHPRECIGCPRNGTCELQQLVMTVGIDFPYSPPSEERPEPLPGGSYFERDYSLCVKCGRCVRVCHEVRGARAIVFRETDPGNLKVGTPYDRALETVGCEFCGACIDVCPVGALREKRKAFFFPVDEAVPESCRTMAQLVTNLYRKELETQWSDGICPICGAGCRLSVELAPNHEIVSIKPDERGPANAGQGCAQGRFSLKHALHSQNRIKTPKIRDNGSLQDTTWEEALAKMTEGLRSYDPDQIAIVTDARATNEDLYLLKEWASEALRTNLLAHVTVGGGSAVAQTLREGLGTTALTNPLDDLTASGAIFVIGVNPTATHPIAGVKMRQAVMTGAKLVVANPYDVAPARYAHVHLRHVPGTESILVHGLLRLILDEGGADPGLDQQVLARLKEDLAPYDIESVSRRTGIDQEVLSEAACLLANRDPLAVLFGTGLVASASAVESVQGLIRLSLAKGSLGKEGGGIGPLYGNANSQGAEILGYHADIEERLASGQIKALFVTAQSLTDTSLVQVLRSHRDKVELLILHDTTPPPEELRPDVVLPAPSLFETSGSVTSGERRIQWTEKVVEPPDQARSVSWIVSQLAAKWNIQDFGSEDRPAVFQRMTQDVPAYQDLTVSDIKERSPLVGVLEGSHASTVLFADKQPPWPSWPVPALPDLPEESLCDDDFPYKALLADRVLPSYGGPLLVPEALSVVSMNGEICMNATDAYRSGWMPGDSITVIFKRGESEGTLAVNDHLPLGVVVIPRDAVEGEIRQFLIEKAMIAARVEKR